MSNKISLVTNTDIIKLIESGKYDAVGHGCNSFHTMGSGVAHLLNVYTKGLLIQEDRKTSHGDINKLGSFSKVDYNGIDFYNLYTQFTFGRDHHITYVHWDSVENALQSMIEDSIGTSFLIPLIGCGLANGKYSDLYRRVEKVLDVYDVDVTLVTNGTRGQLR